MSSVHGARARAGNQESGSLDGEGSGGRGDAIRRDGVVAAMTMEVAAGALLLHVRNLAARCHLAITANDAATCQRPESEESHQAHIAIPRLLRKASSVPLR